MKKIELWEKCLEDSKKELKKKYYCKSVVDLAILKYAEELKKQVWGY